LEGNFRADHSWFKTNIEAISLYQGFSAEKKRISGTFEAIIKNRKNIVLLSLPLYISQDLFGYLGSIINYGAVGVSVLYYASTSNWGEAEISSLVAKSSYCCLYLINGFTIVIQLSKLFSEIGGLAGRISELLISVGFNNGTYAQSFCDEMGTWPSFSKDVDEPLLHAFSHTKNKLSNNDLVALETSINGSLPDNPNSTFEIKRMLSALTVQQKIGNGHVQIENLSIALSSSISVSGPRLLMKNLNLTLARGQNLLVTGPSGCGKSSLFRVLGGLWNAENGYISFRDEHLAGAVKVAFVAQKPYCFRGTLGSQMTYPLPEGQSFTLQSLASYLDRLNLGSILNSVENPWTEEYDWPQILSPGEQQRLSICRVLLQAPDFVFLDETSSAMDEVNEENIYKLLELYGITCVSIGHRSSLQRYHNLHLQFELSGEWSIASLN